MRNNFLEYLIQKKYFALSILFIIVLVFSLFSIFKIPVEIMPKENASPFLYLSIGLENEALPEQHEILAAIPVERALKTLPRFTHSTSTISSNQLTFMIYYRPKSDMNLAYTQLQELMQELADNGLFNMKKVRLAKFNPESVPIIKIAIVAKSKEIGKEKMQAFASSIRSAFESTSGISKIELGGVNIDKASYELSPLALESYKIQQTKIAQVMAAVNEKEAMGKINHQTPVTSKLSENRLEVLESVKLNETKNVDLKAISNKKIIRTQDVQFDRLNGKSVFFLEVFNRDSANLFELKENILKTISKLKFEWNEYGLDFQFIMDLTETLDTSIKDVFSELYTSLIITGIVVFVFMRNFRITTMLMIAVPLSLAVAIAMMLLAGKTLNLLTLSGLILSIGLTVDNSIVVAERVLDHIKSGKNMIVAAGLGASDMAGPLLISTLTGIIIFLPALFLEAGDSFTDLLKIFQFPVFTCMVASYFVSLIFLPVLMIVSEKFVPIKQNSTKRDENDFSHLWAYQLFKKIREKSNWVLLIFSIIVIVTFQFIKNIEEVDLDSPRDQFLSGKIAFGGETSAQDRRSRFFYYEKFLLENKQRLNIKSVVTSYNVDQLNGQVEIYPVDESMSDEDWGKWIDLVKNEVSLVKQFPASRMEIGDGTFDFKFTEKKTINLIGTKYNLISSAVENIKSQLTKIDGVESVKTEEEDKNPKEFRFIPHVEKMQLMKINVSDLVTTIKMQKLNIYVDELLYNGIPTSVIIRFNEVFDKNSVNEILNSQIVQNNKKIPLLVKDFVQVAETYARSSIRRKDNSVKMNFSVYFKTEDNSLTEKAKREVNKVLSEFKYPQGVTSKIPESSKKFEEMKKNGQFVIGLSVFLVFLILGSLFESLLIPLAILFTVPLAIVFGIFGLKVLNFPLDPMARLGLLILVGTAVSNAVILIDVILQNKANGMGHHEAIVIGCAQRIDSVLMSSSASILGILPVALGNAKIMGIPYSTLGICTISGLSFCTILTLVIAPIAYDLFARLEAFILKKKV